MRLKKCAYVQMKRKLLFLFAASWKLFLSYLCILDQLSRLRNSLRYFSTFYAFKVPRESRTNILSWRNKAFLSKKFLKDSYKICAKFISCTNTSYLILKGILFQYSVREIVLSWKSKLFVSFIHQTNDILVSLQSLRRTSAIEKKPLDNICGKF